jgi:hypothetical protein
MPDEQLQQQYLRACERQSLPPREDLTDDDMVAFVADFDRRMAKTWGYMHGEVFRPLPKTSLQGLNKMPPFYVELPDGRVRYIVEEPET